jgi:hypothetical protein
MYDDLDTINIIYTNYSVVKWKNVNIIIEAKITAHNRSVTASPPVGGSGYEKPQPG